MIKVPKYHYASVTPHALISPNVALWKAMTSIKQNILLLFHHLLIQLSKHYVKEETTG